MNPDIKKESLKHDDRVEVEMTTKKMNGKWRKRPYTKIDLVDLYYDSDN